MASTSCSHLQLIFWIVCNSFIWKPVDCKWIYTFEIDISSTLSVYGDGSTDTYYWRLCSDDNCGVFVEQSGGWPTGGETYYHTYATPSYLGEINIIYLIDTG